MQLVGKDPDCMLAHDHITTESIQENHQEATAAAAANNSYTVRLQAVNIQPARSHGSNHIEDDIIVCESNLPARSQSD